MTMGEKVDEVHEVTPELVKPAKPTWLRSCTEAILRSLLLLGLLLSIIAGAGLLLYVYKTGTQDLMYRWHTTIKAFLAIVSLKPHEVTAFIDSYEIFTHEKIAPEDEAKIVDYYNVINHLCALGEVEKMYIPPFLHHDKGCYGNQIAFEEQMVLALGVQPDQKVLELGCGRGRIMHHVSRLSGAHVTGLNLDPSQISEAESYAQETAMTDRLNFVQGSFNDPLPFPDQSFHHFYHVQAFTYVSDIDAMFSELWRVLKPGARLSFLDWFVLDNYDESSAHHRELLARTKALIGGVYTPHPKDYERALAKVGFKVIHSKEGSEAEQSQFPLIERARDFYMPVGNAVNLLSNIGLLPSDTATLLNRLNLYVDDFIESDKLRIFTTSWWILAEKPHDAPAVASSE